MRKILATRGEDLIRRDSIGYKEGVIWVDDTARKGEPPRLRVAVVNLPGAEPEPKQLLLVFSCDSERHRVVVEADRDGKARYRSWNKPRSLLDAEITVTEHGCREEEPPEGSVGELIVAAGGKVTSSWCY